MEEDKEEEEDDEEEEFRQGHMMVMVMMTDRCLIFCDLSLAAHRHHVLISKILFVGKRG